MLIVCSAGLMLGPPQTSPACSFRPRREMAAQSLDHRVAAGTRRAALQLPDPLLDLVSAAHEVAVLFLPAGHVQLGDSDAQIVPRRGVAFRRHSDGRADETAGLAAA